MNKKLAMVLIAIIGIGLYALPSTVALFSGQHTFTNIDATGNQIDCTKCHGDVNVELTSAGKSSVTNTSSPHAAFKCEYCHRVEVGEASGDNAYSQITYSATGTDSVKVSRKLIVYESDMEAANLPESVAPTGAIAGPYISGVAPSKTTTPSPCYPDTAAGCTDVALALLPPAREAMQATALYGTNGVPKDLTESSRYGMFDPSKVTWTEINDSLPTNVQNVNLNGSGSRSINPGSEYHAASLVSCIECHGGDAPAGHHDAEYSVCADCHYVAGSKSALISQLYAGGFGLTDRTTDTGINEAHKEFLTTPDGITRQRESATGLNVNNGACIACHTHVEVDITYQKPSVYKFDVNFFSDGTEGVGGHGAQSPMIQSKSDGSTP